MAIRASTIFGTRNCTGITIAFLLACLLFSLAMFLVTLPETLEFIRMTGGQYCWAYSSSTAYIVSHAVENVFLAFVIYVIRRLDSRERCWPVYVTCTAAVAALVLLRVFDGCLQ